MTFHSSMTAPRQDLAEPKMKVALQPLRIGLLCDFLEERWPSMDLFGDMLFHYLATEHSSMVQVEQLRPAMRRRFSKLPRGGAGALWNADRLLNRFHDYPRWLAQRSARFDLFHLMDHSYAQLLRDLPSGCAVVTCHDLDTFTCLLEPHADPRPRWFRAMAQRSLDGFLQAAHVICVSAFTRENILRHGLFPSSRITVIPPGADPVFFSTEPGEPWPEIVPNGARYLLHVGSTIRRKRIDVLLRVFARVIREYPDLQLVRVGGAFTDEQQRLAAALGITDRIVQCPPLTKWQIAASYRNAALVLQPSEAEGFGLPVIEAMACGCPVVASDIAPLREAGGAQADYCAVGDIDAWAETVIRLMRERENTPEAWELRRERAQRHASHYTWSENAKRTISIYQAIVDKVQPHKP